MAKIKYTKNELRKQKDDLGRFKRYLPTLTLKKQQLQQEILKIAHAIGQLLADTEAFKDALAAWIGVFAEDFKIGELIKVEKIRTRADNIAGIDIPVFEAVDFIEKKYDFFTTPLWIDEGVKAIKQYIIFKIRRDILTRQRQLLQEELRITTQRVNLFEKVMIPQAQENIRKINIVLGDIQTAAVVTGKIAKKKIEAKHEVLV